MPQGFNVTGFRTGCTAHRLVPVDRFFCFFDIPDFRVQRRRLPSWIFSTSRLCSPLVPSTFDPAFDLVFAYVSMCLLSLATISPACPTTWRPPNCGEIVFLLEVCFVCRLGSITAASGRFPPFRLPNRGDTVPSGVFGACLPSFCLSPPIPLTFFRSGDRTATIFVSFGFVQRVPRFLPPPIPSASIHSGCRIVVILLF